jgi:uncharacterized protein (DUF2384 family)
MIPRKVDRRVAERVLCASAETTMSNPLPAEMLDHIVGYLHDTQDALKNCCLVSKLWARTENTSSPISGSMPQSACG